MDVDEELLLCNDDTPEFTLNGMEVDAKIVSVYDGDGLKICIRFPDDTGKIYKFACRCAGYDCPEMRPIKKKFATEEDRLCEKRKAYEARDALVDILKPNDRLMRVKLGEFDKYGRILITIYVPELDISVNEYMVQQGYAYVYHGGTKK